MERLVTVRKRLARIVREVAAVRAEERAAADPPIRRTRTSAPPRPEGR